MAFVDINPQAPKHILLMPRQHIASMTDLTLDDGPILAQLFTTAQKLAHEMSIDESGYRFVSNVGPDSGQSVFHLHFHLLGVVNLVGRQDRKSQVFPRALRLIIQLQREMFGCSYHVCSLMLS